MLFEVINIITEQVNSYLEECGLGKSVSPKNVAFMDQQPVANDDKEDGGIALSLLNIQEETSLKNFPNKSFEDSKVVYKNNVINLNLYILFSANRETYLKSLMDISKIIEFFQGKKLFTQANTVFNRNSSTMNKIENFRFTVELYTPTFEEMNFIWGTLGGKQFPSALYKVSMIQIERDIIQNKGTIISEIDANTNQYSNS